MEVKAKEPFVEKIKNLAFKEKSYFLNRREINWPVLGKCAMIALGFGIICILLLPATEEKSGEFHEEANASDMQKVAESDPTQETLKQLNSGGQNRRSIPSSLDSLYAPSYSGGQKSSGDERNSSMILARGGLDGKSQVPPGSKVSVRLYERAIVANQAMPVIGQVTRDYIHEDRVAIPEGSKLFGDITFDDGDRAKIDWKTIQLPDGRERQISAIGVGTDGQVGVKGRTNSNALMNTVGQTVTRFIGAYAQGSMQTGALGGNPGGNDNGWKNAVSETAQDRAERWADDLKKEKRWIEVSNSSEFYAVLTASFAFRDPGSSYGR
jgi:type IV secretory pathway VirB10-like protein